MLLTKLVLAARVEEEPLFLLLLLLPKLVHAAMVEEEALVLRHECTKPATTVAATAAAFFRCLVPSIPGKALLLLMDMLSLIAALEVHTVEGEEPINHAKRAVSNFIFVS